MSALIYRDTLNITTHDLNVQASSDTTSSKSDTKDLTASIGITMYGEGASSASIGYGEQHATSESETNHNSNLLANTMNINVANDAAFKGATVRANETLNLTVGNNLNIESVRDSYSSNSNGFNVSAGVSSSTTAKTSSRGANASLGTNTGRTLNKQTVLTSLTGDNVNISVGNDTHLKGSLVAAGQTDENGVFQDNQNLNLSTKTLTFENSTNTNYSSSNSMNVGASYSDTLNKEKNEHKDKTTLTTSFSTGMNYERTKTLATLGQGNINITDKENSDDLARLNTDTTQVDKSLVKTSMGTKVDATLDTRLLTEEGRAEIKNQNKELAGNVINGVALAGNIITGNMDVDNAIASFQDPTKMADAIKNNPELAATLDAFTKGQFDNLPKTKEGLQALADVTGLKVDVLLTTVTSNVNAQGATDKKLVALDVNPENRANILNNSGHEDNHARGGTNETLADMSGYATQLLSEAAIGSYDQQYLNGIKFEIGTGKDAQTQAVNQVLLGSDNETLLNALNDHQLEFYFKDSGYYTDPVMKKALGEGLPENHFINRFQSDTAKGFAGLENGLNRLYNLDTSKMSPLGRTLVDYAKLKVVTVPGTSESQINLMDHSSERLTNEIKKDLKQ